MSNHRPSLGSDPARSISRHSKISRSQRYLSTPGTCCYYFDPNATATTATEVEKALPDLLPSDLKLLSSSDAVDQDVYVVTKEFSAQHGINSLEDLKKIAEHLNSGWSARACGAGLWAPRPGKDLRSQVQSIRPVPQVPAEDQ